MCPPHRITLIIIIIIITRIFVGSRQEELSQYSLLRLALGSLVPNGRETKFGSWPEVPPPPHKRNTKNKNTIGRARTAKRTKPRTARGMPHTFAVVVSDTHSAHAITRKIHKMHWTMLFFTSRAGRQTKKTIRSRTSIVRRPTDCRSP